MIEVTNPPHTAQHLRPLGHTGLRVSALGISGHYGLPFDGYATAIEHGVNTFFWEPLYREQTRFFRALSPNTKQDLVVIAGTFEHDLKRMTQNVDVALRAMRIERIALWMLFWVRDTARLCDATQFHLQKLQSEGKIGAFGFSTHQRDVAVYGLTHHWSPLMTRHSAAHRNPETHIFPTVQAVGSGLITFSNLVYGRLLRPPRTGADKTPTKKNDWTAADCYRYSLSFPCVSACLSAPSTMEQLHENLTALHNPTISDEARTQLLAHGDLIYRDNTDFHRWIRGR